MSGYLRRLATTGAAYTAASIVSKVIAVALLPLYTRYLSTADYGAAEILFAAVVAASIVVRLGLIEAILRFYYKEDEDPARVVAGSFAGLFWLSTLGALVLLPFAEPISELLLPEAKDLGGSAPDLVRIAIGGLWVLTMWEFMLTLFRLEERARAYFLTTILNVLVSIGLTVVLVVGLDEGARGLLLGSYAAGAAFVLALIGLQWRRLSLRFDRRLMRRLFDFGLPTMPAEVSLYMLNFVDRLIIVRSLGLAEAGLYSLAVKFAQAVNVLVRGFQLAWPPLAYSIRDDDEARRAYATVVTLFVAGCAWVVAGMWLFSRWIVRALAAPKFFDSYEAIGLIATAVTLYALYLVLVVILGRTGRTKFNFPAAIGGLVANVVLNLLLVPSLGIVGAGLALVASYVVVLGLMYVFTQRLFPVPYEWGRLVRVVATVAALVGLAELLIPTSGALGLLLRTLLFVAYPLVLLGSGFFTAGERRWLARLRHPGAVVASFASLSSQPAAVDGQVPEVYEVERMDEDART
ncbi:MAG TPA: oligosaccharide flippase family protein [Solirubrobacterales bacterium]|jgi:O-antigen/teichoic acid export membrane protein|nr:oligosaccharide flippase family protein [Solirubrobacterales bacterium]